MIELQGSPAEVVIDATLRTPEVQRLLEALGLNVVTLGVHELTLDLPRIGLFVTEHAPVAHCHAWWLGAGAGPSWMHPAPQGAAFVLALLGTALMQERAGAAFRAAGRGEATPSLVEFDEQVLAGVDRAVREPVIRAVPPRNLSSVDELLEQSFTALDRCCAPNGAVAAAPPATGPGDPDYWFFWQRDAAAVAVALDTLARRGPRSVRAAAAMRRDGYLDFVAGLGPRLAHRGAIDVSRCTMAGRPVGGYGDPQQDGPAATALAVLTLDDTAHGRAIAQPFLDHLLAGAQRGYDLWELTEGISTHAGLLRARALRRAGFKVPQVRLPSRHVVGAQPSWFEATSGLDVSELGATLLAYDHGEPEPAGLAERVAALEAHFGQRWDINVSWQAAGRLGAGIGRFPEDGNDGVGSRGGNPWPIATLWLAQWHLHAGRHELAAGYLDFVLAHVDPAAISEQIDAVTGQPRGARALAWAHAELVVTLLGRAWTRASPPADEPWGVREVHVVHPDGPDWNARPVD